MRGCTLNVDMHLVYKLSSTHAGGTPQAGGSCASPRPPQAAASDLTGHTGFSGRQTTRDEEVERWALVLCNEVASASDRHDVHQKIFCFLASCKQHMEAREV